MLASTTKDQFNKSNADDSAIKNVIGQQTTRGTYGRQIDPADRVTLCLPVADTKSLNGLLPIGETILHPAQYGHPGFDYYLTSNTSVLACMDGVVDNIEYRANQEWCVSLTDGIYWCEYQHLDLVNASPTKGMQVPKGSVIAYPLDKHNGCYVFYWMFCYADGTVLNPMSYFDDQSRAVINAAWANQIWDGKDQFPDLVNRYYADKNY
jgi:murein DD-endopeptidase MepM/ murein hydrolase activator NlpD